MIRELAGLGARVVGETVSAARATAGAVAGDLVTRRSEDPLDERDSDYVRTTLPALRRLSHLYFRPKIRGLEHIPEDGPVLLVGNHSGGVYIADTYVFTSAFYDFFGPARRFYQLAHDLVFVVPGLAPLRRYGTVPAAHETAERALATGAAVLLYPGGDHETYRPSSDANRIDFGGRTGFVELALASDTPIVPVVAIGGQETALFLARGERAARALALDRLLRLKVLPVALAPPFGLTVFDLPGRLPLPSQITIQVLPRIDLRAQFGPEPDVDEAYRTITGEMQLALDELARERDVPVLGTVGARREHSDVADDLARRRRR